MSDTESLELPAGAVALLEPQRISVDVLQEKYLKAGEATVEDLYDRVARALASVEAEDRRAQYAQRFREHLQAGGIGAGRIMGGAGTGIQSTLINCFVQPVGDCLQGTDEEGYPGIYDALREAAETLRLGGGVGYDFSRIRPEGAWVRSTQSPASGPCPYIHVFDRTCADLHSAGARRGAQMGVLRIDHPDVLGFITAKRVPGRWNHFNVSVAVTDDFMRAVQHAAPWDLVHRAAPGPALRCQGVRQRVDGLWIYRTLPARELWDTLMRSAYDFAEPGILFTDRIRQDNNLRAIEHIEATNPCGEQPLPPYGCCDLGPLILPRFVRHPFDRGGAAAVDFEALARHASLQVRFLDNVLDLTHWPLPQHAHEARSKRRIGVGFTGLGDTLVMLGLRYDSAAGREMAQAVARCLRDAAYGASVDLAIERGPFPLFNADQYLEEGTFASRLPGELRERIRLHGIRNSHLLCVAPAGTVSLAFADNASNGIEPAFAWVYTRWKRAPGGSPVEYVVEDHALRVFKSLGGDPQALPPAFVSALKMSPQDHIAMMQVVQPYIDAAISKTVNVAADHPYEDFRGLYFQAWQAGLKGLATYRPNPTRGAVLEAPSAHAATSSCLAAGTRRASPCAWPLQQVKDSAVAPPYGPGSASERKDGEVNMTYKRLLVPVDGSELTDKGIDASIALARQLGAAITGFVVEPMPPLPASPRTKFLLEQEMREHDQTTAAHAKQVLERFEAAARAAGVPFQGVFDQAPQPDQAIIKMAESQGCDMIVMVTHGRGAFGEFLFGSQTKAVLAGSKLPLLVLH